MGSYSPNLFGKAPDLPFNPTSGGFKPGTTSGMLTPQAQGRLSIYEQIAQMGQGQMEQDVAHMYSQGDLAAMGYQQQMDALRSSISNAGAQAGIAQQDNSRAIAAIDRQQPLLDQLLGLDMNEVNRGREANYMSGVWGGKDIEAQYADLKQQADQLGYGRERGRSEANKLAEENTYGLRSSAAARGAITAAGTRRSYGNIQEQLQNSLVDIEKNYGWGLEDVDRAWQSTGRKKEQMDLGIKHRGAELDDTETRLGLTDAEQRAKLADERARLENAGRSIGLSAADTKNRINAQIQKLGMQGLMDHNDVLKAIEDRKNQQATDAVQRLTLLEQYGFPTDQVAGR